MVSLKLNTNIDPFRMEFALAYNDYLTAFNADGGFGLGLLQSNAIGYVQSLFKNGTIDENIFALYLNDNSFGDSDPLYKSYLFIGEIDLGYAISNGTEISVKDGWSLGIDEILFKSVTLITKTVGYIDTSAKYIYGPSDQVAKIMAEFIDKYSCMKINSGFIQCDCPYLDSFDNITFIVSGNKFSLTSYNYFYDVIFS